jgi:acyl-CoA reductase-like NAD-dependent aldehyde dehydrogenase
MTYVDGMDLTKTTGLQRKVAALLDAANIPPDEIAELVRQVGEAEEARDEELARALSGEGLALLHGLHGDERDYRPRGGNWIDE